MSERKPKPYGILLVFLALAVLTSLFVWPTTGWLVRLQLISQVMPQFGDKEADQRRVAEANPRDYEIQMARALTAPFPGHGQPDSVVKIQRLRELTARFPDEPSLYAHILRFATQGQVMMHRNEWNELSATPSSNAASKAKPSAPQDLAAFDSDAANGERLDPDNAYFPLIRAVGLYEAHRDAEAIAAIHRAAQKTRYEDYSSSEFGVVDKFFTLAHGQRGAIARTSMAASILFPQYAQLRGVARMGTMSAVHAEIDGKAKEGFAIRRDIMRAGALMRVQGHSLICNLVGIAITAIPASRPGGAPAEKSSSNLTEEERTQNIKNKREKYFAYLRTIGHEDEARWAESEMQAGAKVKEMGRKISDVGPFSMASLRNTCLWWAANLLTLTNALGLLILGAAAAFAAAVSPGRRLKLWRGVFGLAVAGVFALWLMNVNRGVTDWVSAPIQMIQSVSSMQEQSTNYQSTEATARIIALVLALALPILMVTVIGIASLTSKVPFCTGLGRGLRGLVLPVACALFLLYSLLLVGTARHEATMSAGLDSMVAHEGNLLASQIGQEWPGPTR